MNRLLIASLAALSFAAPLASGNAFADPNDRYQNSDRGYDQRDDRRDDRQYDRRDDRRNARQSYRHGHRDWRQQAHFDRRQHNGYYVGRQWYYGPPSQAYASRSDIRYDYRDWRRGDRLPRYYQDQYRQVDYRAHRLNTPPRGARWVEDDRGDYLLVGIATGLILGLAFSN